MALLDILDCSMEDLIEPVAAAGAAAARTKKAAGARGRCRRPASQAGPHSRRRPVVTSPGRCERAVCRPDRADRGRWSRRSSPSSRPEQIRAVVTAVAGGRAKSRRLAAALAGRPAVLADGRSPAPRAVGDLLLALRQAGAAVGLAAVLRAVRQAAADLPAPRPGLVLRGLRAARRTVRRVREGRPVSSRDRAGQPRCAKCPDARRP